MRILGFSKKWDKLNHIEFTTFRKERLDKDWFAGEVVQVFYKPRSKEREFLGLAHIIFAEPRHVECYSNLTNEEAERDGFLNRHDMLEWLRKTHGDIPLIMNKLILRWVNKEVWR